MCIRDSLTALLAELDCGEHAADEVEVERHEGSNYEGEDASEDISCHDEVAHFIVKSIRMAKSTRNDRIAGRNNQQAGHRAVEEHVHEEFVIVEAYAVGDPRTVMVHLEYAAVAL